jgi:uncharacterized protein (TIGR02996 family)
METEDAALWRAVVADPHDDAPRLILADWLEERGRPERAEFIRVQCRLAALDEDDPDRSPLERRERQLWQKHKAAFRAGLPARIRECPFRRGFVHPRNFHLTGKEFLQLNDDVFAHAPLWDVRLGLCGPGSLDGLVGANRLSRLSGLEIDCSGLEARHLAEFLNARVLENVRELGLRGGPYTPDHLRAVTASPVARRLTRLSFYSAPRLGREGAQILTESSAVRNLEVLTLTNCGLGDGGLRALLASPHLTGLKELRVPSNGLTAAAVRALNECRHLRGLRVLDLFNNQLDDDGARVLALCPAVDRLSQLDLGLNRIHRSGAESLARSPFLLRVRRLSLLGNPCAYDPATVTGLRFRFADRVTLTER